METVSVSQVQTYLICPLKYRFQYIDKIARPWRGAALAFGASVHSAIEWFHRERLAGRSPLPEAAVSMFTADWFAQNLEPLVFGEWDSKETLGSKGAELVRLYVGQAGRAVSVEEPFDLELADPRTGELLDVNLRGRM